MGGERRGKRELTLVFFVLFPVLVLTMVGGCGSKEWGGGRFLFGEERVMRFPLCIFSPSNRNMGMGNKWNRNRSTITFCK